MYSKIINNILKKVLENRYTLIKTLFIPTILMVIVTYYKNLHFLDLFRGEKLFIVYLLLFSGFITICIAINTYRVLLLEDEKMTIFSAFRLGFRELKFIFKSTQIAIISGLVFLLSSILNGFFKLELLYSYALITIGVIISIYIFSRLSLVLPSVSIDKKMTVSKSWNLTKNHKFLVFFIIGIFPMITSFLLYLVYGLVIKFLMGVVSSKLVFLYPILDVIITVFVVSCVSVVYEFLQEQNKEIENMEHLTVVE